MLNNTIEKKFTSVEISFCFENDITQKDLESITKKVNTFSKNTDYETIVSIFHSRNEINAILMFDVSNGGSHKIYDELRSRLTRLIDSHKQAATYGWDSRSFSNF
jgi:hypothetical protein